MDTIIDKVKKLLRLSQRNSNANEAAAAAAKAQELIDQHRLSAALLDIDAEDAGRQAEPEEPIVNFATIGAPLWDEGERVARWRGALAVIVSRANACRVYQERGRIQIIGRPSDVETVRYLFAYIVGQVDTLADHEGAGAGPTWRNNFRIDCVDTIARKFEERKREHTKQLRASAETSVALVRVDRALAHIERRAADVDAFIAGGPLKLRKRKASRIRKDASARRAGQLAGERINIHNRAKGALGGL